VAVFHKYHPFGIFYRVCFVKIINQNLLKIKKQKVNSHFLTKISLFAYNIIEDSKKRVFNKLSGGFSIMTDKSCTNSRSCPASNSLAQNAANAVLGTQTTNGANDKSTCVDVNKIYDTASNEYRVMKQAYSDKLAYLQRKDNEQLDETYKYAAERKIQTTANFKQLLKILEIEYDFEAAMTKPE
jgi:hypothetical protein